MHGFHVEIMLFQRAAEQDSISYLILCTLYGIIYANSQSRLFLLIQQSSISENRKVYGLMLLYLYST